MPNYHDRECGNKGYRHGAFYICVKAYYARYKIREALGRITCRQEEKKGVESRSEQRGTTNSQATRTSGNSMMYAVENARDDPVCDRSRRVFPSLRQQTDTQTYFGRHELCRATLDKLRDVDSLLEHDLCPADPAWTVIKPKEVKTDRTHDEESMTQVEVPKNTEDCEDQKTISSTQFFFSQKERIRDTPNAVEQLDSRWSDSAESLYETLENTNETLALVHLKTLSDTEVVDVVKYLSDKLSSRGTYNLCRGICAMGVDQSMIYVRIVCRYLLLQKIIDLQEPCRIMSSAIHELADTFPEDVQESLYIPILNAELRDTTIVSAMINVFGPQRRNDLIANFLTAVHKLKEWHIVVLSQLINTKLLNTGMKDKLLNLLVEKASTYSRNKNYGKFILTFVKVNTPFTEEQKGSLNEIVAVNETIFKRVMESLLKNMYLYSDLWHIS